MKHRERADTVADANLACDTTASHRDLFVEEARSQSRSLKAIRPIVIGKMGSTRRAADFADLAEHDRGDHRADAVWLGQRGARLDDGRGDALFARGDLAIEPVDVGQILAR